MLSKTIHLANFLPGSNFLLCGKIVVATCVASFTPPYEIWPEQVTTIGSSTPQPRIEEINKSPENVEQKIVDSSRNFDMMQA